MTPPYMVCIGAGGMATNIVDFFNLEEQVSHYLDTPTSPNECLHGVPVIDEARKEYRYFSVIGDPREKYAKIKKLEALFEPEYINLIHYEVWKAKSVEYGYDVVVQPFTSMYSRVKIGNHVLICGGTRIGHDTVIGDYCTISPEVAIAGSCQIGKGVFLGINCTVRDGIKIGNGATIGAGAVVVSDVPEDAIMMGVPAKYTRSHDVRWYELGK